MDKYYYYSIVKSGQHCNQIMNDLGLFLDILHIPLYYDKSNLSFFNLKTFPLNN